MHQLVDIWQAAPSTNTFGGRNSLLKCVIVNGVRLRPLCRVGRVIELLDATYL